MCAKRKEIHDVYYGVRSFGWRLPRQAGAGRKATNSRKDIKPQPKTETNPKDLLLILPLLFPLTCFLFPRFSPCLSASVVGFSVRVDSREFAAQ